MTRDYTDLYKEIKDFLKEVLSDRRYDHSLRVADYAKDLARAHGLDEDKAYLAGLAHDIGKKREEELLPKYDIGKFVKKEDEKYFYPVLHSFLGAYDLRDRFGVDDDEVLDAIIYHTTGRPHMTDLEKLVYIADGAEPGRDRQDLVDVRELALEDLDRAMLRLLDSGLVYCVKKGVAIHTLTLEARNYFIKKGVDFE